MLVVNPNNRLLGPLPSVEPPLWAGLIAGYHDAAILDAEAHNLTLEQTEQAIRRTGQKDILLVVMGNNPSVSSTPKMPVAEALADRLMGLNVSMTGIHPIAAGSRYPVVQTPFEGTPSMPWRKLPMSKYKAHNWHCLDGSKRWPYASIYTSLGCPYDCYYCNIHTLYPDRKVRLRPVGDIVTEVGMLTEKYGVRNIKIWDELFALHEDRVLQICKALRRFPGLNIWAYARLDTVTERMLRGMKAAGINWLAYGFESVRDSKFTTRTEDVIRMTREAGISIMGNFLFGLPGMTADDDTASLEFAKANLFEFVNFYDAKPYPGSKWFDDIEPVREWSAYDQHKYRSEFRKQAFNDYFTNPAYLSMIQNKWGNQAVDHVKEMLAWRT